MDALRELIETVEAQLGELKGQAGRDVSAAADDIADARGVVDAELTALMAKLKAL
jgi:hypothetical protein